MSRYDLDNQIKQATTMDMPLTSSKQPRWQRKNDSQLYNSFNVSCLDATNINTTAGNLANLTIGDQRNQHKHPSKTPSKTPSKNLSSNSTKKQLTTPAGKSGQLNTSRVLKTPKTPSHGPDRFITNRQGMDLEISHYLITQANRNGQENDFDPKTSENANSKSIGEMLNANLDNYRIMCYTDKAPVAPEGQANNLKVLYSSSKATASTKKTTRIIPSQPEKILDAPEITNDWYLNLIDWSGTNIVAVALSSEVYLWNAATGDISNLLQLAEREYVSSISWIQEGNHVAVGTSLNEVEIWDAEVNRRLRVMRGHSQRVCSLDWNSFMLSSGSKSGLIHHHDVRVPDHHVGTLNGHSGQEVCGLKWSPDGKYLASGGNDNSLNVWSANNQSLEADSVSPVHTFHHNSAVKALAWCPWKSHVLASGGGTVDRTIKIWNATNGNCLYSVDAKSQVCGVLWSEEYQELISGHGFQNYELAIWKYPGMTKVSELKGHTGRILGLAMSPDKSTVVSVGADETLRFWECFGVDAQRKKKSTVSASKATSNPIRLSLR